MNKRFKYMRVYPICGNTFETDNNELITCVACDSCKATPKKKNLSLILNN